MTTAQALLSDAIALRAETKVPLRVGDRTVPCRPPNRAEAMAWLARLARCYDGDVVAMLEAVTELPAFLDVPAETFEQLTPMETVVIATRFFLTTRPAVLGDGLTPASPSSMPIEQTTS